MLAAVKAGVFNKFPAEWLLKDNGQQRTQFSSTASTVSTTDKYEIRVISGHVTCSVRTAVAVGAVQVHFRRSHRLDHNRIFTSRCSPPTADYLLSLSEESKFKSARI